MRLKYAVLSLAVVMGFTSMAQAAPTDYFWGIDAGYTLSDTGNFKQLGSSVEDGNAIDVYSSEYSTSGGLALGLYGGLILQDQHKISFGYRADSSIKEVDLGDEDEDSMFSTIHEFYAKYDYLVPITHSLDWTVGATLGYEQSKVGILNPKGIMYGVQTGLEYRFTNWVLGTEVAYVKHNMEDSVEARFDAENYADLKVEYDDEVQLMTHIEYRF
ncbi:hypothetical protein [Vibrio paucivorans]